MSKLPPSPLPTKVIQVNGRDVSIRSMSRTEARTFAEQEGDSEHYILACGADVTEDEARAWLSSVDTPTATGLMTEILRLSGLTKAGATDEDGGEFPTSGSMETSGTSSSEP